MGGLEGGGGAVQAVRCAAEGGGRECGVRRGCLWERMREAEADDAVAGDGRGKARWRCFAGWATCVAEGGGCVAVSADLNVVVFRW